MRLRCRIFFYAVALTVFSVAALAQVDPDLDIGFKPFGAYDETTFDSVSLANGNLTLHIPLFDYPQRGGLKAQVRLMYNSKGWKVKFDCTQTTCEAFWIWENLAPTYGEQVGGMMMLQTDNGQIWPILSTFTEEGLTVYSFSGQTLDGNIHQFGQIGSPNGQYRSIDGSGIYFNALGEDDPTGTGDYVMLDRDGNGYTSSSGTWSYPWQDTNGNYFLYNETQGGWYDTLGRPLFAAVSDGTGTAGCSTATGLLPIFTVGEYSFPGPNNSTRIVKLCYATLQLKTHFSAKVIDPLDTLIPVTEYSGPAHVVQSVIVNDGTGWSTSPQWSFQYNDTAGYTDGTNFGDITQVTLPTGGTIAYSWWTSENWLASCTGSPQTATRGVWSRTINANDGMGNQTTTIGSGAPTAVVTDPAGNDAVHTMTGLGYSCSLYETEVDYYKGSHTAANPVLLKTVQTAYSWTTNPFDTCLGCVAMVANVVPTSVTTKWPIPNTTNFLVSQVQTDYDNSFTFYPNDVSGGTYGRVTEKREYDYGLNAPGALLRKTDYTYAAVSGSSYLTANLLDLVTQKTVYNSSGGEAAQATYSYDTGTPQTSGVTEQHTTPNGVRGNLTQVQEWSNISGPSEITTQQTSYYDTGMPYQATDLRGNQTTYSYSSANYGAYVTQTQYPNTGSPAVTHIISGVYDFNTGLLTSFTDQNSQNSTYGYDLLGRVTSGNYPDGGSVGFSYNDIPPVSIQKTVAITATLPKVTNSVFDGLGRVSETQLLHDPDCGAGSGSVKVDYTYGNDTTQNTHYTTTTTPYCNTPGTTFGLPTRTDSDALGRAIKVTETDGSLVTTGYAANTVGMTATVKDEAGITRLSQTDGLGRMTKVLEDPNNKDYETDYGYDTLNNLTSVTQKGSGTGNRVRSFSFDSLSRLSYAVNPESGTISYTYSNASTGCAGSPSIVCSKTAPSPNQPPTGTATVKTTYAYDALNRITGKSYTDGYTWNTSNAPTPAPLYAYDGTSLTGCTTAPPALTDNYPKGRRTSMCDGSGATSWAHDSMGRVLQERRTIGTVIGNYENDAFNLDGSVQSMTSLGYSVGYTYSAAARPLTATNSTTNFVSGATYFPPGELAGMTLGAAPITVTNAFNNRLQPILLSATSPSGTVFSECFDFHLGVAVTGPAPCVFSASAAGDNGNVYQIWNNRDNTRNQSFTYDSLNRIANGQSSGTHWGEAYTTDAWGNMTAISPYNGKPSESLSTTATTTNQLVGYGYDPAGNMTGNGSTSYVYDAENRLLWTNAQSGYRYVYDGDGERVEKCVAGTVTTACPTSGTNNGTLYWKGTGSDPLSETDLSGDVLNTYIFFNGQRVARNDSAGVHYYFSDHLGSHAVVENATGSVCEQDIDYYPYGGQEFDYCSGTSVPQHYKFTGKERDSESGNDYFGARYYGSNIGRFYRPDDFLNDTQVRDPQSWNLYAYGRNNPLRYTDSLGESVEDENLTDEERKKIIDQFRSLTGFNSVSFNGADLVVDESAGFSGGSTTARQNLLDAINSDDEFNLKSVDTTQVAFAEVDAGTTVHSASGSQYSQYTVSIDFKDFGRLTGDKEAVAAFGIGEALFHEIDHKLYGDTPDTPNGPGNPGPVENNYINKIRQELGIATRQDYSSSINPLNKAQQKLPFKAQDGKTKLLLWRTDQVGGKDK
jgi:RHS repeat-associated protein